MWNDAGAAYAERGAVLLISYSMLYNTIFETASTLMNSDNLNQYIIKDMTIKCELVFIFLSINFIVSGQNLIQNPGFENHKEIICIGCGYSNQSINNYLPGWKGHGFLVQIFDRTYNFNSEEIARGYDWSRFPVKYGNSMVEFKLYTNSNSEINKYKTGYLLTEFKDNIKRGKTYRLRYSVFIEFNGYFTDIENLFLGRFGVHLIKDKPIFEDEKEELISANSPFLLDTIVLGEWIDVEYIFRSATDFDKLIIGWFDNLEENLPKISTPSIPIRFFADNLSVELLQSDSFENGIGFTFPNKENKHLLQRKNRHNERKNTFPLIVNFASGASELSSDVKEILKDIKVKLVENDDWRIVITGHTDDTGENNMELSKMRACNVKKFLFGNDDCSNFRSRMEWHGSNRPIVSNDHIIDKAMNRRVEIHLDTISASQYLYCKASLFTIEEKWDSALHYIKPLLNMKDFKGILLLYDPEMKPLKKTNYWKSISYFVKRKYDKYQNPELAYLIDSIYYIDHYWRSLGRELKSAKGYIPSSLDFDYLYLNKKLLADSNRIQRVIQNGLNAILNESKYGWPTEKEVGMNGVRACVTLYLHCEDLSLKYKFLNNIENAFAQSIITNNDYARLIDNLLLMERDVQRYGSYYGILGQDSTFYELEPLENRADLDSIRSTIGLGPKTLFNFRRVSN